METGTQYHITFMQPVRVKLQGVSSKVVAIDALAGDHTGATQDFHVHTLYLDGKTVRFTGTLSVSHYNIAGYIAQAFREGK